jgi:fatty acid desaturase
MLSGVPTGARIADYRASHLLHHGRFGTQKDPDLERYRQLGLEDLERRDFLTFARSVVVRLPRYQFGWLSVITSKPVSLLATFIWTSVWIVVPAWLMLGVRGALLSAAAWFFSYTLVLPVIRFVGESSEHIYTSTQTVVDATISNIGFWHRILFHPHNDGYHTAHHMWPGVPHHRIRFLHNKLKLQDAEHYAMNIRYRTRVLQNTTKGI